MVAYHNRDFGAGADQSADGGNLELAPADGHPAKDAVPRFKAIDNPTNNTTSGTCFPEIRAGSC